MTRDAQAGHAGGPGSTCFVVLNRRAGRSAGLHGRRVLDRLAGRAGVTIRETGSAASGRRAVRDAARAGVALVVAAGGDGTVRSAVAGLLDGRRGARPELSIVPLGRGNDLARAFGFEPDAHAVADLPDVRAVRPLDVGLVHVVPDGPPGCTDADPAEPFVNSLGIGLEGAIAARAARLRLPGVAPYVIGALVEIALGARVVRAQGRAGESTIDERVVALSIGNGPTTGGGFRLTPGAAPGDGALDWALLRATSRPGLLAILPRALRGRHAGDPRVLTGRGTHFGLEFDPPAPIHADGDLLTGAARRVAIELQPAAVVMRGPRPA